MPCARTVAALLLLAGCAAEPSVPSPSDRVAADRVAVDPAKPAIRLVAVPAGAESGRPRLSATPTGSVRLSWSEPGRNGHVLRTAVWADTGWAAPQTADRGDNWFVNWADTPGVVELATGQLVAHTLVSQPAGGYAYDVRARVHDGTEWSAPVTPHTDGTAAEHGFVSVVPFEGKAGLIWLDGREQAGGGHGHGAGSMTLRFASLAADGTLADEAILDDRTCDCCPTAAVATPRGVVVAYRDRSASEVRDIRVVRHVDGAWTEPVRVYEDGWTIDACPVNGPALAASGERVALAWFTNADSARVRLARSEDGGATFGPPILIDGGAPIGRVTVAMRGDEAVVGWLERDGDEAIFLIRTVDAEGVTGDPTEIARVPSGRASGIPQIVALGDRLVAAWTDPEADVPLRTALVTL